MDMEHSVDEVINEISKIERAASNIEDESQREKEEYARLIDNKIKEFDERVDKETEENLANLRLKLEEEKRKELTAMRSEIVARTEKMDELYERNKEKWVDEIVQEIIKE
ncbi:MAG: hypothetical protein IJD58_07865 [Lachnospiraceae bacterium]|nr:hypothetical protein [Lachnospiraceae bacterium]